MHQPKHFISEHNYRNKTWKKVLWECCTC